MAVHTAFDMDACVIGTCTDYSILVFAVRCLSDISVRMYKVFDLLDEPYTQHNIGLFMDVAICVMGIGDSGDIGLYDILHE